MVVAGRGGEEESGEREPLVLGGWKGRDGERERGRREKMGGCGGGGGEKRRRKSELGWERERNGKGVREYEEEGTGREGKI